MGHPLIDRLTEELGWPLLTEENDVQDWINRPGVHVLFVPGDWHRNLETTDVAVILPELQKAFQGSFDCAVVGEAMERGVKEGAGVFKTPSLVFYAEGGCLGGIPKVRDWDDYVARITRLIDRPLAAA